MIGGNMWSINFTTFTPKAEYQPSIKFKHYWWFRGVIHTQMDMFCYYLWQNVTITMTLVDYIEGGW